MDLVFRTHPQYRNWGPADIGHGVGTYRIESARTKIGKVLFDLLND